MLFTRKQTDMPDADSALPGRETEMPVPARHEVLGTPLKGPFPSGVETLVVGMGCFWGAERIFWQADGVYTTAVGYAGGLTPNPTYEEVCSGRTGHTEAVLVAFDTAKTTLRGDAEAVLGGSRPHAGHAPGQRRRQPVPLGDLLARRAAAQGRGSLAGGLPADAQPGGPRRDHHGDRRGGPFYYAEEYHQQYLAKNPGGYCGLGGTGVSCPIGLASQSYNGATPPKRGRCPSSPTYGASAGNGAP